MNYDRDGWFVSFKVEERYCVIHKTGGSLEWRWKRKKHLWERRWVSATDDTGWHEFLAQAGEDERLAKEWAREQMKPIFEKLVEAAE